MSRCGIHLDMNILSVFPGSTSSPHFHNTLWGNLANASRNASRFSSDIVSDLSNDPILKYITPCSDSSMNF